MSEEQLLRPTSNLPAADVLLDEAPGGFLAFADDGTVRYANATLLGMLGTTRDAVVGAHVETLMTVGTRIFYQTHFFPLLRLHGRADEIFLLLRAGDGTDVAALANARRRERGGEWVTECLLLPVVERRKFEDALLRARQEAEQARDTAEARGRALADANALLEAQAAELEMHQQQLVEQQEELEQQQEALQAVNDELHAQSEELARQRTAAEEASRAKSTFLTMMSHELRTPLNAIRGYVQLLEMGVHGELTAPQLETLGRVQRSQAHLLRLIDDLLDLARIESGRVEYRITTFALREATDAVLPMVEPQMAERGIVLAVDVPPGLRVHADREKVDQVLLNLLANAAKFTDRGGRVSLRASAAGDRVAVAVADTGIGIAADQLDAIFEPFVQASGGHARKVGGTGLGLTISRDLARAMGGDLTVESQVGVGTTFTLMLPGG